MDKRHQKIIFITLAIVSFVATYIAAAFNIALPTIGRELGMERGELPWIGGIFALTTAVLLVPFGRLADLYGKKKIFLSGLAVLVIFSGLASLSAGSGWMFVTAAIGGIGTAMCFSNVAAILTETFDQSVRGRILGGNVAVAYIGASGGPFLGGLITQYLGWRAVFWTMLPLLVVGLYLAWRYLPERVPIQRGRYDRKGSLLYVCGLALLILGISCLSKSFGIFLIAGGVIVLYFFVRFERTSDSPLIDLSVFGNRVFTLSNLASFIHYGTTYSTALLLSMFLQDQGIKALTASMAGLVLFAQPLTQIIFSPIAGRLSDRMEPRWLASSGMAVTALCLLALAFIKPQTSIITLTAILLIMGAGFSFFVAPNNNAIMSAIQTARFGLASGVMATGRILGMSLSLAITTMLLDCSGAGIASTVEFMHGFQQCFIVFSFLAVAGIAASLARGSRRTADN